MALMKDSVKFQTIMKDIGDGVITWSQKAVNKESCGYAMQDLQKPLDLNMGYHEILINEKGEDACLGGVTHVYDSKTDTFQVSIVLDREK